MRPRTITLTIVCAVALAGLFSANLKPSSGQQQVRLPGCACFVCGELHVQAGKRGANLPFNYLSLENPNCEAGILAESACPDVLSTMPREKVDNFCRRIKEGLKFTSFKDSCPVLAKACEPDGPAPPPEKKCEKPTPWFDPSSSSGCKDMQAPEIKVASGDATVRLCGVTIFSYVERNRSTMSDSAYAAALQNFLKSRIGSKVCCDKFWEAWKIGTGCLPPGDLDCDGIPNDRDSVALNPSMPDALPDINIFRTPEGAPIDPFPEGLDPDDPNFFPPVEKCDCKWEMLKGTLTCSPDGKQKHVYQARWRCPSTGNEIFTRKEAAATAPCKTP